MMDKLVAGVISILATSAAMPSDRASEAVSVVDLSVYDRSFASALFAAPSVSDCPSCVPKTPVLDSPTELIIPGIMSPPSSPTPSGLFIEYRLAESEAGECKVAGSEACSNKNCEFTLAYKISGDANGSYGYGVDSTFPPSTPSSTSTPKERPPGASFAAEWEVSKPCGGEELFDIEILFYVYDAAVPSLTLIPGSDLLIGNPLGCAPCESGS